MDYIGYTMNICLILFMISVTGSHCQYYSNRDIILTPHQLKTYPGKILYYRPTEFATGPGVLDNVVPAQQGGAISTTAVPWEEVLKETVFLALNDNKTSAQSTDGNSMTTNQPLYITRQQKAIYAAPYIGMVDLSVPRFGDIVELAHGRLEKENDDAYYFVQDDSANPHANGRNVSAYWKVERIRHRDEQRGHRYELKFTVAPIKDYLLDENAIVNRSFVVRDEDYPRYFGFVSPNSIPMTKKSDQFMDRAVFDPVMPYHPAYSNRLYRPTQATMTLGEYLIQSLFSSGDNAPKLSKFAQKSFRSFNRVKFPDSAVFDSRTSPKYYHHIHFQRPSIAPLAPTLPPSPPLIKDLHIPASSNIQQDQAQLVDFRGTTESLDIKQSTESNFVTKPPVQQPQVIMQNARYPSPMLAIQPYAHHHHLQQPIAQQTQQQQQQFLPQQQQPQQQPLIAQPFPPNMNTNANFNQLQNNPPPALQPLPPNLVQSIPIYNPQSGVMLNHIPISPNHMIQMPQAPIAIPVHVQLLPQQGQVYTPQQDGQHAVPIRIMQPAPVQIYSPVNPFLAPQHYPAFMVPRYHNQTTHFPHHTPNSIPTTLKYSTPNVAYQPYKYTPQPSTSPVGSPTAAQHRYSPQPTVQSSTVGQREKFTPSAFQPVTNSTASPYNYNPDADTAGSSPIDSASPKFQSFGIENAVTPKTTTVLPVATASDSSFTPSIGHTSSVHSGFFSNFLEDKGSTGESGKLFSDPDPLYHKTAGTTTPISITSPSPSASSTSYSSFSSSSSASSSSSSSGTYTNTAGPSFTPKFTSQHPYKPSATSVPQQIETPISSTLKSYHYLNHDSFDFVPSRVVELAHVKKIPKKQGSKRKNPANLHQVTVTSHKPLKFSESPDHASTNRPEAQLSVQLPPPDKEYTTYYGTLKQSHKVQKPKNYVTQPYISSSTTPFPTSLTTPASSISTSTTPSPASVSATTSSLPTSLVSEKPFTHYQPYFKNKNEKSDDIITTMRPRLVIKTIYKPYPSSSSTINSLGAGVSTEKPILKWVPKRLRNKTNSTSTERSSSSSSSASIEQLSASAEHSTTIDASTSKQAQTSTTAAGISRPSLENQVNRLRASRGRSRYTHRRFTTPGTPTASQNAVKVKRIRTTPSTTTTSTTAPTIASTVKPISGVTSSIFDSSRLESPQQPPVTTESSHKEDSGVAVPLVSENSSKEKSKRDAETEENEVLVAEPLVSKLAITTGPAADYDMIQADIKPVETNATNILLFTASDASVGPSSSSSRSFQSPSFDDLTMSIINHARALANQTQKPADADANAEQTSQTEEIQHKAPEITETTVPMTTVTSTSAPSVESTAHDGSSEAQTEPTDATAATVVDQTESDSDSDSGSETTVSVDV
ncbi:mucin-5AC-like [Wyeomyia smithii]|uniref:mucin-5AC-like n=1 Tax=Wyeomyia smithii TaxID=174621 RepID=UPI002467E339|nr:mucin-5AC-like [Wyeomyia smithii]